MVDSRERLEKLKEGSTDQLNAQEASLRAAEARLSAFKDALATLGEASDPASAALNRRLQEKMKKEQAEITELKVAVERARARAEGFDEVLRLLQRDGGDDLRAGTVMHEVRELLRAAARPMHLDEILKKLGCEDKRNSLRSSLAAYANKGRVFTKEKEQETFGLIEFPSNTSNQNNT